MRKAPRPEMVGVLFAFVLFTKNGDDCVPKLSLVYVNEHRLLYELLNINERVLPQKTL
jgi:hypothetical protein